MANKNQNTPEVEANAAAEQKGLEFYLTKYGKIALDVVLGILVVIALVVALNRWYVQPKSQIAQGAAFDAERFFMAGDFEKALNGDGNALGFADIIAEYGKKAGASMPLYAGTCELQLGNYQSAIDYLKKYKGKDKVLAARALCCIGDAYVGLEDNAQGLAYYEKAAAKADNIYRAQYLFKAGLIAEELGQKEKALKYYEEILVKYPGTIEGSDINKYIYRVKGE